MGLELDVSEMPSLAQIRTTGIHVKPREEELPMSSTSNEEAECVTPRSEELVLKPALVCPPAPRKPRPAKRKLGPPPQGYCPVPSDLASLFVPLLSCPASRKIRVG